MLKHRVPLALRAAAVFFFAVGLGDASLRVAAAEEPSSLIFGSLRDQTGRAVVSAEVNAYDLEGRLAGHDRSATDGTFAIVVSAAAVSLSVSCNHCASLLIPIAANAPIVMIVTRYRALEQSAPDQRDLESLPYHDPGDAAGLASFVVPISDAIEVSAISDRGLGRGRGLTIDGAVPEYDPATGEGMLFAFPGRSLNSLQIARAARAFSYGSYAGGGTFVLDRFGDEPENSFILDTGQNAALTAAAHFKTWSPALALSVDRGVTTVGRGRADLQSTSPFAGGTLRLDLDSATHHSQDLSLAEDRSRNLMSLRYATAGRLSRTFVDASGYFERNAFIRSSANPIYLVRSAGLSTGARVERIAPIEFDFGASLRAASGSYQTLGGAFERTAHYGSALGYVEAKHDGPLSYDFGVAASEIVISHSSYEHGSSGLAALLPSATIAADLGRLTLRLAASSSQRPPTLFELPIDPANSGAYSLERGFLIEGSLGYDERRRLRVETTLYREILSGLGARTMNGAGVSIAWQIAPRISLRAWTLHDAARSRVAPTPPYPVSPYFVAPGLSLTRGIAWASYEAPGGIRVDGIFHHDAGTPGSSDNIDGDLSIPLSHGMALTAGSAQRTTARRTYFGFRFQPS